MHLSAAVITLLQASFVCAGIQLPAEPADKSTPVQQRISLKGATGISVAWNTYEKLTKPCVQYGLTAGHLNTTVCSTTSVTYPSSRTWSNLVSLSGLKPATKYCMSPSFLHGDIRD